MSHLGIDLGSSFSKLARVIGPGTVELVPDADVAACFETPSVIHMADDHALVGTSALDLIEVDPRLPLARSPKPCLGSDDGAFLDTLGRSWSPEAIVALMLRKLARDARAIADEDIAAVVIGVPARSGETERRKIEEAALLAGLPKPVLVEEATAAAVHLGLRETAENPLLLNLGGGSVAATVLDCSPPEMKILGSDGTGRCSGRLFDEAIQNLILEDIRCEHGVDLSGDAAALERIKRLARDAKHELSAPRCKVVRRMVLLGNRTYHFSLSQTQLESLLEPLVDEAMLCAERCLEKAELSWERVDALALVGGSAVIPYVRTRLQETSGCPEAHILLRDPRHAVAFGCARLAGELGAGTSEGSSPFETHDIGLRTWDPRTQKTGIQVLLPRGQTRPASQSTTVYTSRAEQGQIVIDIVRSRCPEDDPVSMERFAFGPLQRAKRNQPIEVTLGSDADGLLTVCACDPETGQKMERVIENAAYQNSARLSSARDLVGSVTLAN